MTRSAYDWSMKLQWKAKLQRTLCTTHLLITDLCLEKSFLGIRHHSQRRTLSHETESVDLHKELKARLHIEKILGSR